MSTSMRVTGGEPWPLSYDPVSFGALLFDLDGTLVDTMPLHCKAYAAVFSALGYRFTQQHYLDNVGPPARITIPRFAQAVGMGTVSAAQVLDIHAEKKRQFRRIITSEKAPLLPCAALLDRYHSKIPLGLVSSGNRDGVEAILRALGWIERFNVIVTGDDVKAGKPHPDPYLRAAASIGVAASHCLVFEDTANGIESALAAGMSAIDVTLPDKIFKPEDPR